MKNLFCPKINENDVKIRGKTQKSTFLTQKQMSVPGSRLETMILMGMDIPLIAIRKQIASAIDIVIQLERLRDKSRRVTEITEIIGYEEGEIKLNPLFIFKEQVENNMIREEAEYMGETSRVQGTLVASGNRLIHRKKLENAAIKLRDEM